MSDPNLTENITEQKDHSKGMTVKVLRGSFWVLLGQVLPLVATFIASPFVIRNLGSEAYGVLILVSVISGYFAFGDFGMVMASTRYGAEAFATGDRIQEGKVIRTAGKIGILSSMVIALPLFIFSARIVGDLLKVPVHLQHQASVALKLTSVAYVMSMAGNIFNTPQLSRMRLDLNVLINSGFKILMTLTTPIVLYFGGSIIQASLVAFIAALLIMLCNILVSGKLLPELIRWSIDKKMVKPLMRFGWNMVVYSIGLAIINNSEKFLLTRLVSVKSLAYYSVASTFANMTTMFSMAMVQTLIPAFSQLLAPEKKAQLDALFTRSVRISLMGIIPSIMFLMIIAKPFFTIWAGHEFGEGSIYPYYILLIGIFFSIVVYVPNCILLASGRSDVFAKFYLFEVIPYVAVTYLLVHYFGIIGAALAYSLRETVNALIFIRFARKYANVTLHLKHYYLQFLLGFLVFLPAALFAFLYNNFSWWLLLWLPLSLLAYVWVAWKKMISDEERAWGTEKIRAFTSKFRRV